jgi:hypothetical protein
MKPEQTTNTMPNDEQNPTHNVPASRWVWHCTNESIAAGQISVLAIVEIFVAMGIYWWLVWLLMERVDWRLTFMGMIAAPILLLRSNESIEHGVKLLRAYWSHDEKYFNKKGAWITGLISGLATGLIAYWLAKHLLIGYFGGVLFFRSVVLVAATVAIAVAGVFALAGSGAGAGEFAFSLVGPGKGTLALAFGVAIAIAVGITGVFTFVIAIVLGGTVAVAGTVVGAGVVAIIALNSIASETVATTKTIILLLFGPFIALAILIRVLYIRLCATMCHFFAQSTQLNDIAF